MLVSEDLQPMTAKHLNNFRMNEIERIVWKEKNVLGRPIKIRNLFTYLIIESTEHSLNWKQDLFRRA